MLTTTSSVTPVNCSPLGSHHYHWLHHYCPPHNNNMLMSPNACRYSSATNINAVWFVQLTTPVAPSCSYVRHCLHASRHHGLVHLGTTTTNTRFSVRLATTFEQYRPTTSVHHHRFAHHHRHRHAGCNTSSPAFFMLEQRHRQQQWETINQQAPTLTTVCPGHQ